MNKFKCSCIAIANTTERRNCVRETLCHATSSTFLDLIKRTSVYIHYPHSSAEQISSNRVSLSPTVNLVFSQC